MSGPTDLSGAEGRSGPKLGSELELTREIDHPGCRRPGGAGVKDGWPMRNKTSQLAFINNAHRALFQVLYRY